MTLRNMADTFVSYLYYRICEGQRQRTEWGSKEEITWRTDSTKEDKKNLERHRNVFKTGAGD